ncbi:MAG: efflux RND transporter permease subunit [Candidatus Eremiobacteraeota bacterium]|nr:efflux RND transporter permease subunit [Candidatus Eremiobacteraeota bacterium]
MSRLIRLAIKNRTLTFFVVLLVAIMGIYSYLTMPQNEDPKIEVRAVQITTYWPGATPEDVELYITKPIENAISKQDDIHKIFSQSMSGVSVITVEISKKIPIANVRTATQQIRNYVNDKRAALPNDVIGPDVNDRFGETTAYVIGIASNHRTYRELESIADRMKDGIKTVDGVGDTDIIGAQPERIYISGDLTSLSATGITPNDIINAVKQQNVQIAQPYLHLSGKKILIEVSGPYKSIEQVRNTVVYTDKEGRVIRLKDLQGKTEYGYEEPRSELVRANGMKCVVLGVSMKRGGNITEWGNKVQAKLDQIKNDLPSDVELIILSDQPTGVRTAVKSFMSNFWQAIGIVLLVIGIGMGFRNAMVVSVAIPLIILATFLGMSSFIKTELQNMSINALIIALGMIVDNAVVITDNVNRYIDMGYSKEDAAYLGAKELTIPLFSATATTLAAFIPLAFMPGDTGEYIKDIPLVISFCLGVSYLVAMFVTPSVACLFLPSTKQRMEKKKKQMEKRKKGGFKINLKPLYYGIINFTMKYKSLTIVMILVAFALTLWVLATQIPIQFFPDADESRFTMNLWLPEGYDLDKTSERVGLIEDELLKLKKEKLVKNYVTYIGFGGPRFYIAISPTAQQENYAQVVVNTYSSKGTDEVVNRFGKLSEKLTGTRLEIRKLSKGPVVASPIQVRIAGPEVEPLKKYAIKVGDLLRDTDGVTTVSNDYGVDSEKIVVQIDQGEANLLGITSQDIAGSFLVGFQGYTVSRMKSPDRQIDIVIRLNKEERGTLADVKAMKFSSNLTGKNHRLDEFAQLSLETQTSKISRYNQRRTITINANVKGRLASEVLKDVKGPIEKLKMDSGYDLWFAGEQESSSEAFGDLGGLAAVALMLLLLILSFQFKSIKIAAAIYLTLPMALIGSTVGMYIMKQPLGFMSALGLISLAGIVVNNAIVMIEFVFDKLREGKTVDQAIKESGVIRFRPIMLTTISTLGGLLPLAFFGGTLFAPMCWVIIFGLSMSTVLTLVIVPLLFVLLGGSKDALRQVALEKEKDTDIKPEYEVEEDNG